MQEHTSVIYPCPALLLLLLLQFVSRDLAARELDATVLTRSLDRSPCSQYAANN